MINNLRILLTDRARQFFDTFAETFLMFDRMIAKSASWRRPFKRACRHMYCH
jgi:hypothetical protein